MNSLEKQFICTFQKEGKSYLIQLKVEGNATDLNNRQIIRSIVEQTINQNTYLNQTDKNIRLKIEPNRIYVFNGLATNPTDYERNALPNPAFIPTLRIIDVANRSLPSRNLTFRENYASLWLSWPVWIPVVNFAWWLVVCPLICLARCYYPRQVLDASTLQFKADPHHRYSLEDALQETIDIMEPYQQDASKNTVTSFKEALNRAKAWRECPNERAEQTDKLYTKLQENLENNKPTVISGGYWKDKTTFEPILWSFSRNEQGKTVLSEMAYGKEGETSRNYTFDVLDEAKCKQLLFNLMALTEKESDIRQWKREDFYAIAYGNLLIKLLELPPAADLIPSVDILFSSSNIQQFKEGLIVEAGGKMVPLQKHQADSRVKLNADPMKLIQEILHNQFPEAPFENKALFSLHVLHHRLNIVLQALPILKKEEKEFWLNHLQKKFTSLQRQLLKAKYGNSKEAMAVFGNALQKLKAEVDKQYSQSKEEQVNRVKQLDQIKSNVPYHLNVNKGYFTQMEELETPAVEKMTPDDLKEIELLSQAFEQVPAMNPHALTLVETQLKKLVTRVNTLIVAKQYDAAKEICRLILPLIPEPSNPKGVKNIKDIVETGFWKALLTTSDTVPARKERSNQIKAISDELGKLTQYFWESKVRTDTLLIQPDEWIHMLNMETAMWQFIQIRMKLLTKVSKPEYSSEERNFMAIAPTYKNNYSYGRGENFSMDLHTLQGAYTIEKEMFLRPEEHPLLAKKYHLVEAYLRTIAKEAPAPDEEGADSASNRSYRELHNDCQKVLAAAGRPSDEDSAIAHFQHYYDRNFHDDAAIPSQFSDLGRHQLFYASMLQPHTAIGHNIKSIKGVAQMAKNAVNYITKNIKDEDEEARKRYQAAKAILDGYDRLEITSRLFKKTIHVSDHIGDIHIKFIDYGIVPTNYQYGKDPDISINPSGKADIHEIDPASLFHNRASVFDKRKHHKKQLGKPSDVFNSSYSIEKRSSEASKLSETLSSENPHFLDKVHLEIKGRGQRPVEIDKLAKDFEYPKSDEPINGYKSSSFIPYQNFHNIFDRILQSPSLMEYQDKNKDGELAYNGQRRFYEALFSSRIIPLAIKQTPEYFLSHAEPIKKLLDASIKEGHWHRFYFLLYLVNTVHQHAQVQLEEMEAPGEALLRKKIQHILDVWPNMETLSSGEPKESYLTKALLSWEGIEDPQAKTDAAAYLIALFSNSVHSLKPDTDSIPALGKTLNLAKLLQIGNHLNITQRTATLPIVAEQGICWMQEYFIPFIMKSPERRSAVLDIWTNENPVNQWQQVPGKPYTFTKGAKNQITLVDLKNMQIFSLKGEPVKGVATHLPKEILEHIDYQRYFGTKNLTARMQPGKESDQYIYTFEEHKSFFRILFDKEHKTLSIERRDKSTGPWLKLCWPTSEATKESSSSTLFDRIVRKFYRKKYLNSMSLYERNKMEIESAVGMEKNLLQSGVWVNPKNPAKSMVYLREKVWKDNQEIQQEIPLRVRLSSSGQVQLLQTTDGMDVVNAGLSQVGQSLSCLPQEQMLFLKKPKSKVITEIRFLNQKISLKRTSENDPWILHGDDALEGGEWVVGENRGIHANKLWQALGEDAEKIGFTVRKGDKITFIHWPHQTNSKPAKVVQTVQYYSPLKMTITEGSEVSASAASSLFLAYQFSLKQDYVKAMHYIQRARAKKVESLSERQSFNFIEKCLIEMPVESLRAAAFKLKALLALRKINREQNPKEGELNIKEAFASDQLIQEAYSAYNKYMHRGPFASVKEAFFLKEENYLSLSGEESLELKFIIERSFAQYIKQLDRTDLLSTDNMHLQLRMPTREEIQLSLPLLVKRMSKKEVNPDLLLKNICVSEESIVEHFFTLYDLIQQRGITPDKLQMLFYPNKEIQKVFDLVAMKEKSQAVEKGEGNATELIGNPNIATLDVARKLLLIAACENLPGAPAIPPERKVNLEVVKQLQASLPNWILTSKYALLYSGFVRRSPEARARYAAFIEKQEQWPKLMNKLHRPIGNKPLITLQGLKDTSVAFQENKIQEALANKMADFNGIAKAVGQDQNLFGSTLHSRLRNFLLTMNLNPDILALQKAPGSIVADELIQTINQRHDIDVLEALREEQGKKRISQLEIEIKEAKLLRAKQKEKGEGLPKVKADVLDPLVQFAGQPMENRLGVEFAKLWSQEIAASSIDTQKANLKKVGDQLIASLSEESEEPMQKTANRRLAEGLKEAQKELHAKIAAKTSISKENIKKLRNEIDGQKENCKKRMLWERGDILVLVKKPEVFKNLSPKLQHAIKNPDTFHEEELLYLLENAYQSMELKDANLCRSITRYLLEKAALKVLGDEVENQMNFLERANEQGADPTANDWIQAATQIHHLLERALNFDRYLDPVTKQLSNPRLHRKVLVLESRQAIIATKEQLGMTIDMYRNPTDWYELKVGLGKTSVVFKLLFLLLIEDGERPTAVGREELLQQLEDSLDRGTRESSEYAGVDFTFRFNDSISPLMLQEKYIRLLEVRSQKGYPITTASSIQAIDQRVQLLSTELEKAVDAIKNNPDIIMQYLTLPASVVVQDTASMRKNKELLKKLSQIDTIQKNIYYLTKIKEDLNFLIIDEADDVLGVIRENNVGLGEPTILDQTVQKSMDHLMNIVLDPDNPATESLRDALKSQRQAALDKEMPNLIVQLAMTMIEDEQYFEKYVGIKGLSETDKSNLVSYLTTIFKVGEEVPSLPNLTETAILKLGALKDILQVRLPRALKQQPNIDSGVKESDEFQIGPKASGRELHGTIFADQQDTIINHYLYYSLCLPASDNFVKMSLKKIQERHFDAYSKWVQEAGGKDLIQFLNEPNNYKKRMDFLRLVIFDAKMIRHFNKQIVFNVQDLCRDRRVGGMTGTRNRDCLPFTGEEHPPESKKIVAQVLLETAILGIPQVKSVAEEKIPKEMQECAKNNGYKGIINQGYFLENGDTKQWIAKLREAAPDRIYEFVDSNTRKFCIWRPDEIEPKEISSSKLEALRFTKEFKEKGLVCYGPCDNRGVDAKIPAGKVATFLYPNGSLDDAVQTFGRARGAGDIHSMDFFVSDGIKNRMGTPKNKDELLYTLLILDICQKDLLQQTGKVLKSSGQSLKTTVKMGTHQLIFGNKKERDEVSYWNAKGATTRLTDLMQTNALMKVAGHPTTGWLEEVRKLDLKQDFAISRDEDIKVMMKRIYDFEKEKIDRLTKVVKNNPLFQTGSDYYLEKLGQMQNDLDQAHARFLKKVNDTDEVIFPATVPTNGSALPTMQAQMQQVQQQQVQQQQQQVQSHFKIRKKQEFEFHNYKPQNISTAITALDMPKKVRDSIEWFWQNSNIKISRNFVDLFQLMRGQVKGDLSFCRLLVKGNQLCLITANDYSHGIAYQDYDAIYSLMNPKKHYGGLVLDKLGNFKEVDPLMDQQVRDTILPQIVQAKWFLGFSEYSSEEEEILHVWLTAMKNEHFFKVYIEQLGTSEQEKLMYSLLS